jgi:VWFA-related protein
MALLLSAASLASQNAPDPEPKKPNDLSDFKLTSKSTYVLVPVVVRKKGKLVSGLTISDFIVQENGAEKKIATFEEVAATVGAVQKTPSQQQDFTNGLRSDSSRKRLTIIVLDLQNTPFADWKRSEEAILRFLSAEVDGNSLIQLAITGNKGLKVIHDFTDNPQILKTALERATKMNGGTASQSSPSSLGGSPERVEEMLSSEVRSLSSLSNRTEIAAQAFQQRISVDTTLQAFKHLALATAGLEGRKSLIWLTAGVPGVLPYINEDGQFVGPDIPHGGFERTMQMLSDANVAVYPVDARGLFDTYFHDASLRFRGSMTPHWSMTPSVLGDQDRWNTMNAFAGMTGGKAFYNSNDIEKSVQEAIEDNSHYYLLSYALDSSDRKYGWRKLKVRVHQSGFEVHSRPGFFFNEGTSDPSKTRKADVMNALGSPVDYTALPLRFRWTNIDPVGDKRRAKFQVEIPSTVLANGGPAGTQANLDIALLAFDDKNQDAGHFWQGFILNPRQANEEKIRTNGIDYRNQVELPPGKYKVRVVVRDNLTGRTGSLSATIEIK